jgi:hypothetical protein
MLQASIIAERESAGISCGGAVKLDVTAAHGKLNVRWLEVDRSEWRPAETMAGGGVVSLTAPGDGRWVALLSLSRAD